MAACFAICLVAGIAHAAPPPKPASPEIFSFTPAEGPAGTVIKLKGTGFDHTRFVLFCTERTGRNAQFKVVSDTELEVTAPPYLRSGVAATLVVVTPNGATVGVPPSVLEVDGNRHKGSAATFYHVLAGGHADSPKGIVLVENGGIARAPHDVSIGFVKSGGTLQAADRFSGLLIHEPGAILSTEHPNPSNPSTRLMRVREITASRGIEPFLYHNPISSDAPATAPPIVKSIYPSRIPVGGIVTLSGTGLAETKEVVFVPEDGAKTVVPGDFRIVSDSRLEVEIPESLTADARMLVVNPKGATIVVAQNDVTTTWTRNSKTTGKTPSGQTARARSSASPLIVVTGGTVVADAGTRGMYFVKNGGRVTHTGGNVAYFIQDGGRVEGSSGTTFVVREPDGNSSITGTISATKKQNAAHRNRRAATALVTATTEVPEADREVESLSLSIVPATFEIVSP